MHLELKVPTSPRPSPPKGRRGRLFTSPSPLNGERAGVRGENGPARSRWFMVPTHVRTRRHVLSTPIAPLLKSIGAKLHWASRAKQWLLMLFGAALSLVAAPGRAAISTLD